MSEDARMTTAAAATAATLITNEESAEAASTESVEVQDADNHSSSTEGPDSPAHSTSSSPLGMMIPAYPDTHEEEDDQPLLPLFGIKFSHDANKDGDVVRYKIRVRKLAASQPEKALEETLTIEREYDDIEFLHHTLTTHNQVHSSTTYVHMAMVFHY